AFLYALQAGGLAYPDRSVFGDGVFKQFVSLSEETFVFFRPDPDPDRFTRFPETAVEEPTLARTFSYSGGNAPSVLLDGIAGGVSTHGYAADLWKAAAAGAASDLHSNDRQLDADLGCLDQCWTGRAATNPVVRTYLAYGKL